MADQKEFIIDTHSDHTIPQDDFMPGNKDMQNINSKYVVDQAHRDANSSGLEKDNNNQS